MSETTTVRLDKHVVEWLNSLKGFLEYQLGEKLSLNDALIHILADIDALYAKRQNLINYDKNDEIIALANRRADQFWGPNNTDKPVFDFGPAKGLLLGDFIKRKKSKTK
jgi:hypothetical protein